MSFETSWVSFLFIIWTKKLYIIEFLNLFSYLIFYSHNPQFIQLFIYFRIPQTLLNITELKKNILYLHLLKNYLNPHTQTYFLLYRCKKYKKEKSATTMHVENVSRKIVHLFIRQKPKNHVSSGRSQATVAREKIVSFITPPNNKKRKTRNSCKNVTMTAIKSFKEITI